MKPDDGLIPGNCNHNNHYNSLGLHACDNGKKISDLYEKDLQDTHIDGELFFVNKSAMKTDNTSENILEFDETEQNSIGSFVTPQNITRDGFNSIAKPHNKVGKVTIKDDVTRFSTSTHLDDNSVVGRTQSCEGPSVSFVCGGKNDFANNTARDLFEKYTG